MNKSCMKFSIEAVFGIAPGLLDDTEWEEWANSNEKIDPSQPIRSTGLLPKMVARRLSEGSRSAIDVGLNLCSKPISALVFSSRHGELQRAEKILLSLNKSQTVSPTDFTMSVHNTAVGNYSIFCKLISPATSISAGADSFHAGLVEAYGMLSAGLERILLIDFESSLPSYLGERFPKGIPFFPYSIGLVMVRGEDLSIGADFKNVINEPQEPSSIQFMRAYRQKKTQWTTCGSSVFSWRRNDNKCSEINL